MPGLPLEDHTKGRKWTRAWNKCRQAHFWTPSTKSVFSVAIQPATRPRLPPQILELLKELLQNRGIGPKALPKIRHRAFYQVGVFVMSTRSGQHPKPIAISRETGPRRDRKGFLLGGSIAPLKKTLHHKYRHWERECLRTSGIWYRVVIAQFSHSINLFCHSRFSAWRPKNQRPDQSLQQSCYSINSSHALRVQEGLARSQHVWNPLEHWRVPAPILIPSLVHYSIRRSLRSTSRGISWEESGRVSSRKKTRWCSAWAFSGVVRGFCCRGVGEENKPNASDFQLFQAHAEESSAHEVVS